MGRSERAKGYRREAEFARMVGGQRVPLSGAAGGEFGGDVVLAGGLKAEVKARANGFTRLYKWLEDVDMLALKADRRDWLIVLPLERFQELLRRVTLNGGARQ